MNNIAKIAFTIGILNWSVLLILGLLIVSPLGHIPGPAHPAIILFGVLFLLTIVLSLISEVISLIVLFSKNIPIKWKFTIFTINTSYLVICIIIFLILIIGGEGV